MKFLVSIKIQPSVLICTYILLNYLVPIHSKSVLEYDEPDTNGVYVNTENIIVVKKESSLIYEIPSDEDG